MKKGTKITHKPYPFNPDGDHDIKWDKGEMMNEEEFNRIFDDPEYFLSFKKRRTLGYLPMAWPLNILPVFCVRPMIQADEQPYVFLKDKKSSERIRMDAYI